MAICKLQKLFGRWMFARAYRISTKPFHQIEVSYQSGIIKASASYLLQEMDSYYRDSAWYSNPTGASHGRCDLSFRTEEKLSNW